MYVYIYTLKLMNGIVCAFFLPSFIAVKYIHTTSSNLQWWALSGLILRHFLQQRMSSPFCRLSNTSSSDELSLGTMPYTQIHTQYYFNTVKNLKNAYYLHAVSILLTFSIRPDFVSNPTYQKVEIPHDTNIRHSTKIFH